MSSPNNSSKYFIDGKHNNNNVAKAAATKLKSMVTSVHLPSLNRKKKNSISNSIDAVAAPSSPQKEEKKKTSAIIPIAPPSVYVNTKQPSTIKSVGTAKAATLKSPPPRPSPSHPPKTKKKQESTSKQVSIPMKKSKRFEISEDDWKFEKFRSQKLDAFEAELKQLESVQDEMKQLVEKTFNDEDYATLLVQSLLRMVEEVPDILKSKAMGVQDIRDISEEIDRIRDQCRDIHSQIKKQKEELHKGDDVTFSRSIYIIMAFIMDCFISVFLSIVWFFETVTGIKAPKKLHDISKWPTSIISLQLKNPISIPNRTLSSTTASNSKNSSLKQYQQ
uniref:Uncharacterized protein n=1 Tax=Panagrolaimus sp. PS1159 TaxID=55785 RepID=A0AC35FJ75_9BILA